MYVGAQLSRLAFTGALRHSLLRRIHMHTCIYIERKRHMYIYIYTTNKRKWTYTRTSVFSNSPSSIYSDDALLAFFINNNCSFGLVWAHSLWRVRFIAAFSEICIPLLFFLAHFCISFQRKIRTYGRIVPPMNDPFCFVKPSISISNIRGTWPTGKHSIVTCLDCDFCRPPWNPRTRCYMSMQSLSLMIPLIRQPIIICYPQVRWVSRIWRGQSLYPCYWF